MVKIFPFHSNIKMGDYDMGGSGGGSYYGGASGSGSGGSFGGGGASGADGPHGGGGQGGVGGAGGGLLKCSSIRFTAVLNSPQPSVISTLSAGDVLEVSIHSGSSISVVVSKNGTPAGSITGQYLSDLLSCIQNGYDYEATVISISGGQCTVEVSCK